MSNTTASLNSRGTPKTRAYLPALQRVKTHFVGFQINRGSHLHLGGSSSSWSLSIVCVDVILPVPSSMRIVRVVSPETVTSMMCPTNVACEKEISFVGNDPDGGTGSTVQNSSSPKMYVRRGLIPFLVNSSLIFV